MRSANARILFSPAVPRFERGREVATRGIVEAIHAAPDFGRFIEIALWRHYQCDWGDLGDDDRRENANALKHGDRLLSAYNVPGTVKGDFRSVPEKKVWIITEADRSVTTVLFPSEY